MSQHSDGPCLIPLITGLRVKVASLFKLLKKLHITSTGYSVTVFRLSFTSSWKMLALVVLSTLLFSRLGIWQLHRAAEKRQWLAMYQIHRHQPLISNLDQVRLPYQRVQLLGYKHLPLTLLLDNQHYAHQFGYDVLTPLLLSNGKVVLLDHGWVPGDPSRQSLPDLTNKPQALSYTGYAYYPTRHPWVLGPGIEIKTPQMVMIEALDLTTISHFLHKSVYPFIIRQSADSQSGYVRDWPVITGSPTRHMGYAVQWFIFAGGVIVMYILLNIKRRT